MTVDDIAAIVDSVLAEVQFTRPVALADLELVRDAIKLGITPGLLVEAWHRHTIVFVQVHDGSTRLLERTKPVS